MSSSDDDAVVATSQTAKVLITSIILTLLGTIFVVARLNARFIRSKAHGWDDYFMCLALVSHTLASHRVIHFSIFADCHFGILVEQSSLSVPYDCRMYSWVRNTYLPAISLGGGPSFEVLQLRRPHQRILHGLLETQYRGVFAPSQAWERDGMDCMGPRDHFRALQRPRRDWEPLFLYSDRRHLGQEPRQLHVHSWKVRGGQFIWPDWYVLLLPWPTLAQVRDFKRV